MGLEFLDIFSDWAKDYDDFVEGNDPEYKDVFANYDQILDELVLRSGNFVIEFGIGTGNLTKKLVSAGKTVMPIEPSKEMRELARKKLPPSLVIQKGDLQNYPKPAFQVDTIVSSFVFHHLTNKEKAEVLYMYANQLNHAGKILFADTMFASLDAYQDSIQKAKQRGFVTLEEDLKREYYPILPELAQLFQEAGFYVTFQQMNDYVWIVEAVKQSL